MFISNSPYCQSSEVLVDVNVLKWASKDCVKCKGPYQSNWIKWINGYVLNIDGVCLVDEGSTLKITRSFISTAGVFSLIITFVNVLLSFKYGKIMLEPIVHIQTVMLLALSSDSIDNNWIEYFEWFQFAKFDLSFFNYLIDSNLGIWTPSSGKFLNVNFLCEEAILNYSMLILTIILIIAIKIWMTRFNILVGFQMWWSLKFCDVDIFWIFWFVVNPFLMVSIYYDLSTIHHHWILSLILILIIAAAIFYWYKVKYYFFRTDFMQKVGQLSNLKFTYLQVWMRVAWVLAFIIDSYSFTYFMILIVAIQTTLLFNPMNGTTPLKHFKHFERESYFIGQAVMELIVLLVWFEKVSICVQNLLVGQQNNVFENKARHHFSNDFDYNDISDAFGTHAAIFVADSNWESFSEF